MEKVHGTEVILKNNLKLFGDNYIKFLTILKIIYLNIFFFFQNNIIIKIIIQILIFISAFKAFVAVKSC